MINFAINENLKKLAEGLAEEMLSTNSDERELVVPDTDIKLFLVKDGTPKAQELNEIPGAFLGASLKYKNTMFLVFRTNKKAVLS